MAAPSSQAGEAANDLALAVKAYDRATTAGDTATLSEIIADDYVLVNSDASVEDTAQYLERVPLKWNSV